MPVLEKAFIPNSAFILTLCVGGKKWYTGRNQDHKRTKRVTRKNVNKNKYLTVINSEAHQMAELSEALFSGMHSLRGTKMLFTTFLSPPPARD